MIATNLTSICCVYKEKIVKNDLYRKTPFPYKFRKYQHSTRIVTNQFNSKQIIQILQTAVIDYFSTHSFLKYYNKNMFSVYYIIANSRTELNAKKSISQFAEKSK